MAPEAVEAFREQERAFIRQFGRKPKGKDRIFFHAISPKKMDEEIIECLLACGASPEYCYAYAKTGLLLSEMNVDLLPARDLQEWDAAVEEFRTLQIASEQQEPEPPKGFLEDICIVADNLESATVFLRNIIREHGVAKNIRTNKSRYAFHDYLFFCATKALKSLDAIDILLKNFYGEDSLVIARAIYEGYLQMAFLIQNPDKTNHFVAAKVRENMGICVKQTKKVSGSTKQILKDLQTGEEFDSFNPAAMANKTGRPEDGAIHRILYKFLCEHSHPHVMTMGPIWMARHLMKQKNVTAYRHCSAPQCMRCSFWTY